MYVQPMKTFSLKKEEIKKKWLLIDAEKAVLGRLAVISANILRGKNKPQYTPNQDCGDNLIIINADKIYLTGKKESDKIYYRHTGHPGGIKQTSPLLLKEKNKTTEILKLAVKRMLPGGPLAKKQLTKLKIYKGDKHPHEVQNPTIINFKELNKKNTVSI